jgi:hypothetical protein
MDIHISAVFTIALGIVVGQILFWVVQFLFAAVIEYLS